MRIITLILMSVLVGCKAKLGPGGGVATDAGGLNKTDYARLTAINAAQSAALNGVAQATRCKKTDEATDPRVKGGWSSRQVIGGTAECPVNFQERWSYDEARHVLTFTQTLRVNAGGVRGRRALGVITREGTGANVRHVGTIHFDRFEVNKIGLVEADLKIIEGTKAGRHAGDIQVEVRTAGRTYTGRARWTRGREDEAVYSVNGRRITEEGFQRLFSAYGISEIMAKLAKLG